MGLDALDLMFRLEQRFGVRFEQFRAMQFHTVGDVVEIVAEQAAPRHASAFPLRSAYRRVCATACELLGDTTLRFRPSERIVDRVPARLRRKLWQAWEQSLAVNLPRLQRPSVLSWCLRSVAFKLALAVLFGGLVDPALIPIALILTGVAAAVSYLGTERWRIVPPPGCETFGDVARAFLGTYFLETAANLAQFHRDVHAEVCQILSDVLDVPLDRLTPDARLVEDLGMT